MNNAELDTDILIVGAGPVGLFLANECARRRPRWRIVEARPTRGTSTTRGGGGAGILSRFVLLLGGDASPTVMGAARQLAEAFSDIVELRAGAAKNITLVRPDGYVAYAAQNGDELAALKSIRSVPELQIN